MTLAPPYAEVIGDPIEHSRSPLIHRTWLRHLGIDANYRATRIRPDELPDYLAQRRADPLWLGCNVTMPLKETVLPLLDTVHPSAAAVGAVNTVGHEGGRLHGRTTDLHGIFRSLDGVQPLESAVLIGSGGAARSAAFVLRRLGVQRLHIMARDQAKAGRIAADLFPDATVGSVADPAAADLLVNATPLGMTRQPWPDLSLDALPSHATVFDMVYAPARTELLQRAEAAGLRIVGGASMLLHQAAEAFATFFGQGAPEETFAALARELAP